MTENNCNTCNDINFSLPFYTRRLIKEQVFNINKEDMLDENKIFFARSDLINYLDICENQGYECIYINKLRELFINKDVK